MAQSHAQTATTNFSNGFAWARAGFEDVRRNIPQWLGMSVLYLLPAALLINLPFAGPLLVVLLSPMLLAGALLAVSEPETAAGQSLPQLWVIHPGKQLVRALASASHVYPTVLLAIVTLGLVVMTFIIEHLSGAGSVNSLRNAAAVSAIPPISLLIGLLLTAVFQVLLLMALFYAVHRVVYARRDPLSAMEDSFRACLRHTRALTAMTTVYLVPYLVIATAFTIFRPLGYVALFTVGLVSLPALVLASYRSYNDIFPATPG